MSISSGEMVGTEDKDHAALMDLVHGCAMEDARCWERLVDTVRQRCWRYVCGMLDGDANETEDVLQGILIKLFRKIREGADFFEDERHFFNYAWVVIRGEVRDYLSKRARLRGRHFSIEDIRKLSVHETNKSMRWRMTCGKSGTGCEEEQVSRDAVPSSFRRPDEQVAIYDLIQRFHATLNEVLARLAPRQVAVFELIMIENMTLGDAAKDRRTFGLDGQPVGIAAIQQIYHKTMKEVRGALLRNRAISHYCDEFLTGQCDFSLQRPPDDYRQATADDFL